MTLQQLHECIHSNLREVLKPTTLLQSDTLDQALGARITVVSETFQRTGSFKFRAGMNTALSVDHPRIITASSGNFGQAIALASRLVGKGCTVVMPETSARVKIDAVRGYGANVDLINVHQISRANRVAALAAADPDAFVASAYDDPAVVAGNSTLGEELAAAGEWDVVISPVGGGGLISGLVVGLRTAGNAMPILGAEPAAGNDAARSLRAGQLLRNNQEPDTIADGARTVSLGDLNWEIINEHVSEIIEVTDDELRDAVRLLFGAMNLSVEPTGALAVASVLKNRERFRGARVACVVSGGNVDPAVFAAIVAVTLRVP